MYAHGQVESFLTAFVAVYQPLRQRDQSITLISAPLNCMSIQVVLQTIAL